MPVRILITGSPGSGKSTAASRTGDLLQRKRVPVMGFITQEIRKQDVRIGFDLVPFGGSRRMMARKGLTSSKQVAAYGVDVTAVDRVCDETIDRLATFPHHGVVIVDEVGKMELFSKPFHRMVEELLKGPWPLLLTVGESHLSFVQRQCGARQACVLEIAGTDRDRLPGRLVGWLTAGSGDD